MDRAEETLMQIKDGEIRVFYFEGSFPAELGVNLAS
jgi:hypothetical protein